MSAHERQLAARVIYALLRENYGGLADNVTSDGDGRGGDPGGRRGGDLAGGCGGGNAGKQITLRLPGTSRILPLEPDGYTADFRVPETVPLTLDEVEAAVATLAGTRDLAGATAFATECRRTRDEAALRARHLPTPERPARPGPRRLGQPGRGASGPLRYDALAAARPHPVYPASPCRLGLTDNDLLKYAPEFSPGFELRWAAIPKRLVTRSYAEDPAWWPTPERLGLDPGITETHDLFPVHPLTARNTLATIAPRPYLTVRPTLSTRTVAIDQSHSRRRGGNRSQRHTDYHLKLPLPASTLGLRNRRSIVPGTLADGARVGQILAAAKAREGMDDLLLADETRYAHAGHQAAGYLLRRVPLVTGADTQVVPIAALTARDPDNGRLVMESLAGPRDVVAFAGDYFRLVLGVAVKLLVRHGIALESHQQNASLVVQQSQPDQPMRLLVKDFDGTLLNPDRAGEITGLNDPRMLTPDDDALVDVFTTITVHLCVGAIAFGLAEAGAAPRGELLAQARRALEEALEEEADAPAAKLLRVRVLEADRLTGKSMVTAGTLTDKIHTGAADVNKYYGTTGPNYLREAR